MHESLSNRTGVGARRLGDRLAMVTAAVRPRVDAALDDERTRAVAGHARTALDQTRAAAAPHAERAAQRAQVKAHDLAEEASARARDLAGEASAKAHELRGEASVKARDLADQLIPRLAEAVAAAASAGADAVQSAGDTAGHRLQAVAARAEEAARPRRRHRARRFVLFSAFAAALAAGVAVWRQRSRIAAEGWQTAPTAPTGASMSSAPAAWGSAPASGVTEAEVPAVEVPPAAEVEVPPAAEVPAEVPAEVSAEGPAEDTAEGSFGSAPAEAPSTEAGLETPIVEEPEPAVDAEALDLGEGGGTESGNGSQATKAKRSRASAD